MSGDMNQKTYKELIEETTKLNNLAKILTPRIDALGNDCMLMFSLLVEINEYLSDTASNHVANQIGTNSVFHKDIKNTLSAVLTEKKHNTIKNQSF